MITGGTRIPGDDDLGAALRGAFGAQTHQARALLELDDLDLRCPALRARLVGGLVLRVLRQRVRDGTLGVAAASHEVRAVLGRVLDQQIVSRDRTRAHLRVLVDGSLEQLGDLVDPRQQLLQDRRKRVLRVTHHHRKRGAAVGDGVHLAVERHGHLGARDLARIPGERIDHGTALERGLHRVVGDVLAVVKRLDDVVTRGLRAEAELLHLLDQLALRVACGRLGLLALHLRTEEVYALPVLKLRQMLVLAQSVGIDGAIPGHHHHIALGDEPLAGHIEVDSRPFDHCGIGERGHEPAGDEVVEFPRLWLEFAGVPDARGMDRRVVGGLLLAARRVQLPLAEQLSRVLVVERHLRKRPQDAFDVQTGRVHGVVHARIRDETAHVQGLGDPHRL